MTLPLRILHITRDFPPAANGGLGISVGGLVAAQRRGGVACSVVSFDNYRPVSSGPKAQTEPEVLDTARGERIIRVASAAALPRANELATECDADLLHVHHSLLWEFSEELARTINAPTVVSVHVLQSAQNQLRGIETTMSSRAQRRALEECSLVHAPSAAVLKELIAEEPSMAERIRMVRLGHDDWPGAGQASAGERFDKPLLLYVGRFADINGFAQLMDALPEILASHPALQVAIAGGMPNSPKKEKRWIKTWDELGCENASRVRFHGWLGRDDLSSLYGRATALIVPSWFETFGQVVLEGMLHGVPLITTKAGAIPELVDETCALMIEAKSANAIRDAVTRILADPESANTRRQAARKRAVHGRHWDDRMHEFHQLYRAVLESFLVPKRE